MDGDIDVLLDEIDIAVEGADFDLDPGVSLEERGRCGNQMKRRKSGWAADAQQAGRFESAMRNFKLGFFNILQGGLQPLIIGKTGFRRARAACRPAYQLDPDVKLDGSQRSADGLERAAKVMRGTRQIGLLDDGDEGLKIVNPVQSHSPE